MSFEFSLTNLLQSFADTHCMYIVRLSDLDFPNNFKGKFFNPIQLKNSKMTAMSEGWESG